MTHLVVEDVSLVTGGKQLLDRVRFTAEATGSIAIIGPNGAGKSTLLKTIAGIATPTSGRILFDGTTLTAKARAAAIGFVPQTFTPHWNLSVEELIHLGRSRAGTASSGVAGTDDMSWLRRVLRQRWSELSGGEKVRVLLAMVLVTDPPVLLADEPLASLDIRQKLETTEKLASRGFHRLSIVVMHEVDLALSYFERIILIDRGRIVADSTPATLLESGQLEQTFGVRFVRTFDGGYHAMKS